MVVSDSGRLQNRIKSLYRSRGISTAGKDVYRSSSQETWLGKLPEKVRPLARILETCPGLGPIRLAQLLPVVVMPYRFTNKRAFWAYAGPGIVMRTSSDWVRTQGGRWARVPVQQTSSLATVTGVVATETLNAFRAYSRHDLERPFSIGMER
jgi:transposase